MNATQLATTARVPRASADGGHGWLRPSPTHLARLAVQLSLHLRWVPVMIALSSTVIGPRSDGALPLAGGMALYSAGLYLLYRRGWHVPMLIGGAGDCLFIAALAGQRGGVASEAYLLYALPVFYLGFYYAWRGAVAGGILAVLSYGLACYSTALAHPQAADFALASHLFVRGVFFILITGMVSIIVHEQERNNQRMEQMHERLREQVRRLEAIGRITQMLNTVPTSQDVARVIAEETYSVIPFNNCRVHRIEEGPEGAWLALTALYGPPIEGGSALPAMAEKLRLGEGITGWVALNGKPALVHDAACDRRARHVPGTSAAPNSLVAVPVMTKGRVKGVIVLSQAGAHAFSDDDLQMMQTLANAAATALENIESRESLARQARTDAVTGLPHHGAFLSALDVALATAQQRDEPLALALFDIDGFRSYNERKGQTAGDEALRQVGACIDGARAAACAQVVGEPESGAAAAAAPQAQLFRVGGDEFALLLRGPLGQIDRAISLVRDCIHRVEAAEGYPGLLWVTMSAGLAAFPVDATSRRALLDTAEAALYLVRQTGGNRLGLADAAAKETLQLRDRLEALIRSSLAESGSAGAVQQLVAEAASLTQQARHAGLAEQLTTEALRALAAAIDAKDDYTRGHSERVAATATEIARYLQLPGSLVDHITTAARMHDIGKIGVPDQILHKRGALTSLEQAIVAAHPEIGADILAPISTLREVLPIVRHHHEHFDGRGYPDGLAGESIPIGARVVAVADTIDAMITDRPYRLGMPVADALAELQKWAGDHYDRRVVAAAEALYAPGGTGLALCGVRLASGPGVPVEVAGVPAAGTVLDAVMYPEPVSPPLDLSPLRSLRAEYENRAAGADHPPP